MTFDGSSSQQHASAPMSDSDQVGYRPVQVGPNVPVSEARLEPLNPKLQAEFERILWRLRQRA